MDDSLPPATLPTPSQSAPPPPPPNPEKDRLIQEISLALHARAEASQARTQSALSGVAAQRTSLQRAEAAMERERAELQHLSDSCDQNAEILKERISMAERVIQEAKNTEPPGIDEVVVAPSVVHQQLYDCVAEDMAIEDTIYVLGKALDGEKVELEAFLKVWFGLWIVESVWEWY